MPYTEIKQRNGNNYYYRATSLREGAKIKKRRYYLGKSLTQKELEHKEVAADKILLKPKIDKNINMIKKKALPVFKKYGIKKAGVFGSYVRGEQKKESDIDILIEPPKGIGFGFARIATDLERVLRRKVDLVTYKYINHLIRKRILREEIRII